MSYTRRQFLQLSCKTITVLSASSLLSSFAPANFVLPPARKIKLRFAVASDGHYGQPKTDFDPFHTQMVQWLNEEVANRGLDYVFINGDLVHDDAKFVPLVKEKFNALKVPFYVSHGNHDHMTESDWEQIFGTPWHYSFEQKGIPFIVLNTADAAGKYICPDLEWTKEALNKYSKAKQLYLFMHITPKKWTEAGIECPELVEMFDKQKNLKLVFHGHDHKEDNIKVHNNKHYCFDSHIGGNWGTDYRGYRIVEVLNSGTVITYQMNPLTKQTVNNNRFM